MSETFSSGEDVNDCLPSTKKEVKHGRMRKVTSTRLRRQGMKLDLITSANKVCFEQVFLDSLTMYQLKIPSSPSIITRYRLTHDQGPLVVGAWGAITGDLLIN